jgi:hypothetical protein
VRVLGGVADVDTTTVPEDVEVEIVDLDELKAAGTDYIKMLSVGARHLFWCALLSNLPPSSR